VVWEYHPTLFKVDRKHCSVYVWHPGFSIRVEVLEEAAIPYAYGDTRFSACANIGRHAESGSRFLAIFSLQPNFDFFGEFSTNFDFW